MERFNELIEELYSEIQKKATDDILKSIVINDNTLNCKAVVARSTESGDLNVKYCLVVNGQTLKGTLRLPEPLKDEKLYVTEIYRELALHISETLIGTLWREGHIPKA